MGIDRESKLVVGFELDTEKVDKWMIDHDIEDPYDINDVLKEMYSEIPKQFYGDCSTKSITLSIYIVNYGDHNSGDYKYFLTFYECSVVKLREIKNITPELLDLARKIYKEFMNEELDCPTVDDIDVFSELYIW